MTFQFDGPISRKMLNNYLSRAVTHMGLCDGENTISFRDDLRMLKHEGAKFIGRAACIWAGQGNDPEYFTACKEQVALCHQADPDFMLQACVFECVHQKHACATKVPVWVFEAFGQPVENRCFSFEAMSHPDRRYKDHWGKDTTVPSVTTLEGQRWIYYRACSYIDCGFDALHFGQVWLIGAEDKDWRAWEKVIAMIRAYAEKHARRHYVVCDAHCHGLITPEGKSILDVNAFPLRLLEVEGEPMKCRCQVGYLDSLFGRSKGGLQPAGWFADPMPFLVEFDNWGVSDTPGKATPHDHHAWGYDEITWFALQPYEYRVQFLNEVNEWVNARYPEGWVQMPSRRCLAGAVLKINIALEYFDEDYITLHGSFYY